MPTTSPDNIYFPDSATGLALETNLAQQASSVQDAFDAKINGARQIQTFVWANSAARTAQAGMIAGDQGYQTDVNLAYYYNGTDWLPNTTGLFPISPTTVTGGTASAAGQVTFTSSTLVRLNGVFTSTFRNYRIILRLTGRSSIVDINMRLSSGGTDNSAVQYASVKAFGSGSSMTVQTISATAAGWPIDSGGNTRGLVTLDLDGPSLAIPTSGITQFSGGTTFVGINSLDHNVSSAFDGFSLAPTSGAISGSIKVYGYA